MKTIKIKDYYGIYQEIPVSDELYEEWRALQNETQRVHRKEVYHRDWTPIEDLFEMPKSYEQHPMEDTLLMRISSVFKIMSMSMLFSYSIMTLKSSCLFNQWTM